MNSVLDDRPLFSQSAYKQLSGEEQYLALCRRILSVGKMVHNARTGKNCLTAINADFEYDASAGELPLITTRKSYWRQAIAEMLGYLRGYDSAAQFRALGCKTWDANANENERWLANPHRRGVDHLGNIYGVQGRRWKNPEGKEIDQFKKIIDNLSRGVDDRFEIMTFINPGEADRGCLNPCMHTHHFSLLDGVLYLTSFQRSIDVPLGLNFNMVQTVWLLRVVAQITGHQPGKVFHKLVNCHLYEDQIELMRDTQLARKPFKPPQLTISSKIKTLEDLETWVTTDDFSVEGYQCHPAIQYPFSV